MDSLLIFLVQMPIKVVSFSISDSTVSKQMNHFDVLFAGSILSKSRESQTTVFWFVAQPPFSGFCPTPR